MTRADLLAALEILFGDGVPVVSAPVEAVIPPALVLGGSTRVAPTGYWQATYELVCLVGPLDETDLWDRCETLQNLCCDLLRKLPNYTDHVQPAPPSPRRVGDVDLLAFTFEITDHNVTGPCAV